MAKHSKPISTQQYLDIGEIRSSVIILKEGDLRLILLANSINFALKSEREQEALIGQYQAFLNSLDFPIQIVMQSRKLDLVNYLKKLEERSEKEKNELIRIQTIDYVAFIKRLISIANIMDKKIYIVVPLNPVNMEKRGLFDKLFHPTRSLAVKISDAEFKSYREELLQRANVIISGLGSLGVKVAPLNTQQVIELFYGIYNPEEASKERLMEEENLEAPIIEAEKEETKKSK